MEARYKIAPFGPLDYAVVRIADGRVINLFGQKANAELCRQELEREYESKTK